MEITYEDFNPFSFIGFRRSPEAFKAHCRRFYSQKLKTDGFARYLLSRPLLWGR